MPDANDVAGLLLYGQMDHEWSCFGKDVKYSLFSSGTEENIQRALSGLDLPSRTYVKDILDVAYVLRSVAGYNFGDSYEERLKFVRAMSRPMLRLFVAELRAAELKAEEKFTKALLELKT